MAIVQGVPGLQAEVIVDGQSLLEYDGDDAEPDTSTKYIEAISDKEFGLRITFKQPFPDHHSVELRVSIDGNRSRIMVYEAQPLHQPAVHHKRSQSFQKDGKWFKQNYRFTPLNIGD